MTTIRHAPLLLVLLAPTPALACANDSYTERDETQVRRSLETHDQPTFDLIVGQFPHHGEGYWSARVKYCEQGLYESPRDAVLANDRAVALLKLGQYDLALSQLQQLHRDLPNRYEVLSNLGVLHKKMGNYEKAAEFIQRALQVKPGGHMGLGDYYLRMCRWRANLQPGSPPTTSFLGAPYANPDIQGSREFLETLIQNDRAFPDVYLVFGDHLLAEGEYQLAMWAYLRAEKLEHPAPEVVRARLVRAHQLLSQEVHDAGGRLTSLTGLEPLMNARLAAAEDWTKAFEGVEADLVREHGSESVDFDRVESEMTRRGFQRGTSGSRSWATVEPLHDAEASSQLPCSLGMVFGLFLLVLPIRAVSRRSSRARP